MVSPKPNKAIDRYSSSKKLTTAEKIPISAKITIPMSRKSDSKPTISHSGIKKQLEAAKNMPFRSKKLVSAAVANGNKSVQKTYSRQGALTTENSITRPTLSSQ